MKPPTDFRYNFFNGFQWGQNNKKKKYKATLNFVFVEILKCFDWEIWGLFAGWG